MQNRAATVDPGALRDLVEFQIKPEEAALDNFGAEQESWPTDFRTYAQYQAVNSREFPEKWKLVEESTGRFLIRYRSDIDIARHRIVLGGRTFNVTGFREVDNRRTHAYVEVKIIT